MKKPLIKITLNTYFQEPSDNEGLILTDVQQKDGIKSISALSLAPLYDAVAKATDKADETHKLSYLQEGLWYMHQLDERRIVYNIGQRVTITQAVDMTVLKACFVQIIQRHQVLRSRFVTTNGAPKCRYRDVDDAQCFELPLVDLSQAQPNKVADLIEQQFDQLAATPFDLAEDLLLRGVVVKISDSECQLFICFHHLIYDGWSIKVMFKELSQLYHQHLAGNRAPLEPLPFQFSDFVNWQQSVFDSGQLTEQLDYWHQYLDTAPKMLELPYDHARPRVQKYHSKIFRFNLSAQLRAGLSQISQQNGCRLYVTLMSTFQLLLHKYAGQQDFLIGSPTANRRHAPLLQMMGYFTNPLVYRSQFNATMNFAQLLEQGVHSQQMALQNGDVLFNKVVEHLQLTHSVACAPLIQVIFTYQNMVMDNQAFLDSQYNMIERQTMGSQYDLSLEMAPGINDKSLDCWFQYNPDLFEAGTIKRLSNYLEQLIKALIADPQKPLVDYQIMSDKDRHCLLEQWNDTDTPLPELPGLNELTGFHQLFEAQAEQVPQNTALQLTALQLANPQLSYAQLNQRANQLAHYLQTVGVGPDVSVGLCVERNEHMVIAILAILKAGGCYVPLDPEYPSSRLEYVLRNSHCLLIVSESHLLEGLECLNDYKTVALDNPMQQRMIAQLSSDNISVDTLGLTANNLAYLIYTSGSTGAPKGVGVTHKGWTNLAYAQQRTFGVNNQTRALHFASMSFDAAAFELSMALCWGASLHLVNEVDRKSPTALTQIINQNQINLATLPPAIVTHMAVEQLTSLTTLIVAGEAISEESARSWCQGRKLYNAYGPTETTVCATAGLYVSGRPTIGKPLANQSCYVLDNDGHPVPPGVVGHLHVGGAQLARGYIDQPALSAQRFVPNPFATKPGERLYCTGDLARHLPDGRLEFIGRIDHQVKVRGFRIELGEIETVLLQHRHVGEVLVVVREQQLIAYYVPQDLEDFDDPRVNGWLLEHLQTTLPDYMVPAAFVRLQSFVLTPNKKIDRDALPEPDAASFAQASYVAPQTALEKQLVQLWQQNLGLDRIGIEDNYFAIGGDSIRSMSMVAQAQKLGLVFTVAELFAHTSIKALVKVVVEAAPVCESQQNDALDDIDSFSLLSDEERLSLFNQYDISD